MSNNDALRQAAEHALRALRNCYDVQSYPGNGKTDQDIAIAELETALAASKPEPQAWPTERKHIADSECAQGRCAQATTGCWGECSLRRFPITPEPQAQANTERAELIRFLQDNAVGGAHFNTMMQKAAALLAADKAGGEVVARNEVLACKLMNVRVMANHKNMPKQDIEVLDEAIDWLTDPDTHPQPQPSALPDDAEFEVWQNDEMVCSAGGPRDMALRETRHYVAQYAQDGPVQVFEVRRAAIDAAMLKEGK